MKTTKRPVLTNARKGIGSQAVVAKDLKISRQYLGMMETGDRNPGAILMNRMEKYFGIPAEELFPDLFFDQQCHEMLQGQIA